MLIDGYDAVASDLDGVVYEGQQAIEPTVSAYKKLLSQGTPLVFITNNASRSDVQVAEKLAHFGINVSADHIVTAAQVGVELLSSLLPPGQKIFVLGTEALKTQVKSAGFLVVDFSEGEESEQRVIADGVIQGFNPQLTWKQLAEATLLVQNDALWVATNRDMAVPVEHGFAPGNGSFVTMIENLTGKTAHWTGKPEKTMYRSAERIILDGSDRPVKILMVGDRLDTDIAGANNVGMDSAVTLTGIASIEDIAQVQDRPRYILKDGQDLFEPYPQFCILNNHVFYSQSSEHSEALAWVDLAGKVTAASEELDAQRAYCLLSWHVADHQK